MALYHFSMVKDRKPSGARVSAIEHVQYINRDGKYANEDKESENFFKPCEGRNLFNGQVVELYTSPYGYIMNTPNGIKVSGGASPTTISIAMMVAREVYGANIVAEGSNIFKQKASETAADLGFDVTFSDPKMKKMMKARKEYLENERREFQRNGGRILDSQKLCKQCFDGSFESELAFSRPNAFDGPCMQYMPQRNMDNRESGASRMFLSAEARACMENERAKLAASVRRDRSRGRRELAEKSAKKILRNIENNLDTILAESHVRYINRTDAFAKKGGCIYTEHKLPSWAKDDPRQFFKAADRYERTNGNRYYEFQLALPNELSLEQNLEIIHGFIDKQAKDHYYTLAVHDKIGTMSDGSHNLHVHLMVSPRIIDDIEKAKERKPSLYFSRANSDNPEKGGAPKDVRMHSKYFLPEARKDFADITNSVLEKYGRPDRVDHRSIKAMREEALLEGDTYLASVLDRIPERHLNLVDAMDDSSEDLNLLKRYRTYKKGMQTKLFQVFMLKSQIDDMELKELAKKAQKAADEIQASTEFLNLENEQTDDGLEELKNDFLQALQNVKSMESAMVWTDEYYARAQLDFLPDDEKEFWQTYMELTNDLKKWETFSDSIDIDKDPKEYVDLIPELDKKMNAIESELSKMKPHLQELEDLLSQSETLERVQNHTHRMVRNDKIMRDEYRRSMEHLINASIALKQGFGYLDETEIEKDVYTTKELLDILRKRYYAEKQNYENARKREYELRLKCISPERAKLIAESQFTNGEWTKLRKELRSLEKKEQYLQNDLAAWEAEMSKTQSASPIDQQRIDESNQQKTLLDKRSNDLAQERLKLSGWEKKLQAMCSTPEAQVKIQDIALGVLRKNANIRTQHMEAEKIAGLAFQRFEKAKNEYFTTKEITKKENGGTKYKVVHPKGGGYHDSNSASLDMPSIIADAIKGGAVAASVVARSESTDPGKDWKMMTVFDREEEERKALLKEI